MAENFTASPGASASAVFSQSRAQFEGSTPKHDPVKTGKACPYCRSEGKTQVHVIASMNGMQCQNGHKFRDQDELMDMNPDSMPLAARTINQEGYEPITFKVPRDVKETLEKKYGDRVAQHLAALMMAMAEQRNVLVCEADLKEIENKVGIIIKSSAELKGSVIALYMQKKEAMDAQAANGSQSGGDGGGVRLRPREFIVGLSRDSADKLNALAGERKQEKEVLVEKYLEEALENNWM